MASKTCQHCGGKACTFTLIVLPDWTRAIVWLCQCCYQKHQEIIEADFQVKGHDDDSK